MDYFEAITLLSAQPFSRMLVLHTMLKQYKNGSYMMI